MSIVERISPSVDATDGDRTWDPAHLLNGALEVTNNSSSSTVKTFPHNSTMLGSDRISPGDAARVLIWNRGAQDFQLAANASGTTLLVGDLTVPSGGFRSITLVVGYTSGVLAIFSK